MARRAFYSFHYKPDNWRASKVRNMGVVEGNAPATDNDWETIASGGDAKIQKWIDDQLNGKSVAIVLIGENTANRKWINYEITKAWKDGKGVFGIYIHNIEDRNGAQSSKGNNPFSHFTLNKKNMASIVNAYDPSGTTSSDVYNYIKVRLADWIEAAINIRGDYA